LVQKECAQEAFEDQANTILRGQRIQNSVQKSFEVRLNPSRSEIRFLVVLVPGQRTLWALPKESWVKTRKVKALDLIKTWALFIVYGPKALGGILFFSGTTLA
jgi:hypothetical protein